MRTEAAVAVDVSQDILVTIDNFAELPGQCSVLSAAKVSAVLGER